MYSDWEFCGDRQAAIGVYLKQVHKANAFVGNRILSSNILPFMRHYEGTMYRKEMFAEVGEFFQRSEDRFSDMGRPTCLEAIEHYLGLYECIEVFREQVYEPNKL